MARARILNKAGYNVSANKYMEQGLDLLTALKQVDSEYYNATAEIIT